MNETFAIKEVIEHGQGEPDRNGLGQGRLARRGDQAGGQGQPVLQLFPAVRHPFRFERNGPGFGARLVHGSTVEQLLLAAVVEHDGPGTVSVRSLETQVPELPQVGLAGGDHPVIRDDPAPGSHRALGHVPRRSVDQRDIRRLAEAEHAAGADGGASGRRHLGLASERVLDMDGGGQAAVAGRPAIEAAEWSGTGGSERASEKLRHRSYPRHRQSSQVGSGILGPAPHGVPSIVSQ